MQIDQIKSELPSHRAYVLQTGCLLKEGPSRDLLEDPDIRAAYLGQGRE